MSNLSSHPAIVARQLAKRIDTGAHTVEILRGIDLEVPRGQFVAIMGASGSGKSTLLGLLAGLDSPTSGSILLDGADITGLEEDDLALLRGRKVGFVFQSYQLISTLTAEENVLLPLDLAGEGAGGRRRVRDLLDAVGLLDRRDHYPVQLSGGEQQRVALARAFVMRPPILMADEPTGNLDTANGRLVLDLLLQLNQREKATLLLVTHDRELASHADRRITLRDGRIIADELQAPVFGRRRAERRMIVFTIARREARAARGKFLFVILAVAAGVGSLTGVRGFSAAFRTMLLRDARTLMAGDLSARMFALPDANQMAAMRGLEARGVRATQVTETLTMVSSAAVPEPAMISIKAVDPEVYPFYGVVTLNPPGRLASVLNAHTIAVSNDLLLRLKVNVGDMVRAGGQEFRIAAVVDTESDRMSGSLNVGPRAMMNREGLERTGLIQLGSRAAQRFLFRLSPEGPGVEETRAILKRAFPAAQVIDFRETHPTITRGLERATTFLSLVSLIALIVGALGVATAMHSHLQQRMDSIAIMKCLGARSGQIIRIYVAQTLALGLAGGLAGIAIGLGVQKIFPMLIARYFQMEVGVAWDWASAAQGLMAGLLTTLLFTLPPLLSIRRVHPGLVLRREMPESRRDWRGRLRNGRPSIIAGGLILCGLGATAAWLSGEGARDGLRLGAYFIGGIVVSLLVLSAVAWALLRSLRLFLRGEYAAGLPASIRHGMANLYRPGNQATAVLVALGLGVMFSLTIYLVQHSMLAEMARSAPPGMPNVFLVGITEEQRDAVKALIAAQKGVEGAPEIVSSVQVRIMTINGAPIENLQQQGLSRRYLQTRSATWSDSKPGSVDLLQGAWWRREKTSQVSVAEEAAKILDVRPGSRIRFTSFDRTIDAEVACVHRAEAIRPGASNEFIFDRASLSGLPAIYFGGVRVRASAVPAVQRAIYERFPTVTVVNAADVLQIVQGVVDQIALVIRFVSLFTILAGVIILSSSVAGTRFRRIREVVILKTLGATRRRVAGIFSVEFLILGAVAGLMGSILATGFSGLLLKRFFEGQFRFDPLANVAAVIVTALIANTAGWLASFRILSRKPLEALRED